VRTDEATTPDVVAVNVNGTWYGLDGLETARDTEDAVAPSAPAGPTLAREWPSMSAKVAAATSRMERAVCVMGQVPGAVAVTVTFFCTTEVPLTCALSVATART